MATRWIVRKVYCKSNLQRRLFSSATCLNALHRLQDTKAKGSSSVPLAYSKVFGCKEKFCLDTHAFHDLGFQVHPKTSITNEEQVDPFTLVADELAMLANRLRSMIVTEIPKLGTAAEYFFKMGVEGKRFRPMLAVLAGDFLLSRASVALASLKNTEAVRISLVSHGPRIEKILDKPLDVALSTTIVTVATTSMEYYMQKTFYKTASLMANSCKAIALLAGQPAEVSMLAYDYGRHLGLAYQLVDDVLDFTGTTASLGKGSLSDIRQALEFLGKSDGIRKARQLAAEHAGHAASAIDSLPPSDLEKVRVCRKALIDLTEKMITRTK